MLLSQASAATATPLLNAVQATNTATATSGTGNWLDVRPYDGEILVVVNVGVVTSGTMAPKLQSATDANGGGGTDISGATGSNVTTANASSAQTIVVDPKKVAGGFLGFVGTVTSGSMAMSVVAIGKKKYV